MIDGKRYVVIYTDGSMYDAKSDTFSRAGWGVYINDDHPANAACPLLTKRPTTFRAELKAVHHVFQHAAIDCIIRSDCKGVVTLVNKILDDGQYDSKHNDADLLEAIANIHKHFPRNHKITWMPAHLDEEKTSLKKISS